MTERPREETESLYEGTRLQLAMGMEGVAVQAGPQRRSCAIGRGMRDTGASVRREELREIGSQRRKFKDEVNEVAGKDRLLQGGAYVLGSSQGQGNGQEHRLGGIS